MRGVRQRYYGPFVLVTLCLVALCAFTALSLFRQQAAVTRVLRENVESRRAAVELEECLTDLVALENDRVERVTVLHERAAALLRSIGAAADQPGERDLHRRLETAFADYLGRWRAMPPQRHPKHDAARRDATYYLETAVRRPCEEFIELNARRIEASAEGHELVLGRLAWGMAVVGGLGGVAGVVLGFGVARGLANSIGRLRVQIRDAAGKLGPDAREIVVTGGGDFAGLHADVDYLSGRIGKVVAALQQREREVIRAEQLAAVGQLAAGVGHEIRNPLTSIKMLVQAGLEDGGDLAGEDLRVILGEVRRMERSLQTFLDYARPPKTERRRTDLAPVIAGVVELLRGRAEKQKVTVRVELPAAAELTADAEQLRQVFVNLGLNALDAMSGGGTLGFVVRLPAPGRVGVEVSDSGPGISKAILPRLFEPFASSKDTGLGLGLVICRRIVEEHGGTIAAANRPGGGASFFITLPAEEPHADAPGR